MRNYRNYMVAGTLACAALVSVSSRLSAQQSAQATSHTDQRWQAWVGCWQPEDVQRAGMGAAVPSHNASAPLVCVIPTTGAADAATSPGVDVVTIAGGRIAARDHIDANGQSYALTRDGCNGVQSAQWSSDGQRVFTRSTFTCAGGLTRTSTGVFAMSPDGEWVDVQGVSTQGGKGVRTLRYRDAGIPAGVPAEIASALQGRSLAVSSARTAAGAPLTTADVVEASHKVDPAVVEAWLVDRGQGFAVNANQLVQLANAGVPSNVTDAMVALSYPKAFAVDSTPRARELGAIDATRAYGTTGRNIQVYMEPSASPYDYYSPFGYAPYGYSGYGYSGYGYSPYGNYYSPYNAYGPAYSGRYYQPPVVIILKGDQQQPERAGRVVKGRGYTQSDPGSSAGSSVAHPRPSASPPSSTGSSSAEGRSSGSTSSSGRTAKPRP